MTLYEQAYHRALRMAEDAVPVPEILCYLTQAAEKAVGIQSVSSILLLDEEGLLRNGASPRLPSDYLHAIDGIKPDPKVGTCAAAAATGRPVVTENFCHDDKWLELRHLPLALGFKGAWSMPIVGSNDKVIGTFGTYFITSRKPSDKEVEGIVLPARAAATVLEKGSQRDEPGLTRER